MILANKKYKKRGNFPIIYNFGFFFLFENIRKIKGEKKRKLKKKKKKILTLNNCFIVLEMLQ